MILRSAKYTDFSFTMIHHSVLSSYTLTTNKWKNYPTTATVYLQKKYSQCHDEYEHEVRDKTNSKNIFLLIIFSVYF